MRDRRQPRLDHRPYRDTHRLERVLQRKKLRQERDRFFAGLVVGQRSFRKDSITWSVATPTCVAPDSIISSTECNTPATAPNGLSFPLFQLRCP